MKKDNQLMALLSIWGIILVVLGHSGFEEPIIQQELGGLHSWIYSFHMPLFFMISGYLFSLTNQSFVDIDTGKFLWKKLKRLLVPYFVLGTIVYVIKFTFSSLSHATREFTVGNFFYMFIAPSDPNSTIGYLWFIVTLFVIFAIVVCLCAIKVDFKKTWWCLAVVLGLWVFARFIPNVMIFNLTAVLHYLPYFIIGILFKQYEVPVIKNVNGGGYCNVLIFIILSIVLTIWRLPEMLGFEGIIRTLIGMWMSISLCTMALRSKLIKKYLLPFGVRTYSIYLLSWFGQYAAKVTIINILHLHWSICVVGMFVCGIVIPLLVDLIVDKTKLGRYKLIRLIIGY